MHSSGISLPPSFRFNLLNPVIIILVVLKIIKNRHEIHISFVRQVEARQAKSNTFVIGVFVVSVVSTFVVEDDLE